MRSELHPMLSARCWTQQGNRRRRSTSLVTTSLLSTRMDPVSPTTTTERRLSLKVLSIYEYCGALALLRLLFFIVRQRLQERALYADLEDWGHCSSSVLIHRIQRVYHVIEAGALHGLLSFTMSVCGARGQGPPPSFLNHLLIPTNSIITIDF